MNIVLLIWTFGILAIWCQARYVLGKRAQNIISGPRKAILELSAAMREEMNLEDTDLHLLEEVQIKQYITEVQGGRISYDNLSIIEEQPISTVLRQWIVHEK